MSAKLPNRASIVRAVIDKIHCSTAKISKGELKIYTGFFYHPKTDVDAWGEAIAHQIKAAGLPLTYLGCEEKDFIPFKGGAPVWKQNHYCARFSFINL